MTKQTNPSSATREAEKAAANAPHEAGRGPTDEESKLTEGKTPSPGVAEHEKEMAEKGKNQKGEGRI